MQTKRIRVGKESTEGPKRPNAVALGYEPGKDIAPQVLAKGYGAIAEQIIAVAQASGVPIREDPALAAALASVDLGESIPPELYAVVAAVLAYVYKVKQKRWQA
jgi:flagellar biosynthesis protein